MLLCPNCNKQYDDGFTVCALCGQKLIDYKPLVTEEELEAAADTMLGEEDNLPGAFVAEKVDLDENEPQLLVTVDDRVEAERIMTLLEDLHIPCLKKSAGQVMEIMTGESNLGYDIYVPGSMMNEAMEAIAVPEAGEEPAEGWDEEPAAEESPEEPAPPEFEEPVDPVEDEKALDRSAKRIGTVLAVGAMVLALAGIAVVLISFFSK